MESSAVLLHDDACDDILERFAEFRELVETLLDHVGRPLVYLVVLVCITTDSTLDGFFDDVADFINNEGGLFTRLEIVHFEMIM